MSNSKIGESSKPQDVFDSNLDMLNRPTQEQKEAVDTLIRNRFSCRYFLNKSVDKAIVDEIINVARFSPSRGNTQPWEKVYCIAGSVKDAISAEIVKAHKETPELYRANYDYYLPDIAPPTFVQRREDFGRVYYASLGVDRKDTAGRARVSARNYEFFNAPVAFIFTIHKGLTQGSWMDVGYFLQSMSIAARARGLETVSQEVIAKYQRILRKHLPIGEDEIVMCGMSMGYPDPEKIALDSARQSKREVGDIIEYFWI